MKNILIVILCNMEGKKLIGVATTAIVLHSAIRIFKDV